ncbi:hypothetical protein [Streptomyces sp. NPDC006739]|uniref:hypothetical protein n=1 Tax=Streptomyces sp. NPDC006739 TaxID=3364763 RepID=UPI0036B6CC0E
MAWLTSTWTATWPNLLANVLWIPIVAIHHKVMSRRIRALRQHVTALHQQHEVLLVQHVLGPAAETEQEGGAA